jgi:RPA family protein
MSADGGDGGPGTREVAYRLFAREFEDSVFTYKESDEERAPNFVVSPTGGRVNRLFLCGVLTETTPVGGEQVRARVNDLTGSFVAYAGQYQPDEQAFLERTDPPAFLAVTGKARTFTPEDGDRTYSSVRPESVSEVDADTRDRWVVRTAERTVERVGTMAAALRSGLTGDALREVLREAGVEDGRADGTALAVEFYDPSPAYLLALHERAVQAVEVVANERDEVEPLGLAPDEGAADPGTLEGLATLELPTAEATGAGEDEIGPTAEATTGADTGTAEQATPADTDGEPDRNGTAEPAVDAGTDGETTAADPASADTGGLSDPPTAPAGDTEPTDTDPDPVTGTHEPSVDASGTGTDTAVSEPADSDSTGPDVVGTGSGPDTDDVEPDPFEDAGASEEPDDVGEFEPGEFDLADEEREQVESEFGTEFETAAEFDPDERQVREEQPDETVAAGIEPVDDGPADPEPDPTTGTGSTDADPEPAAEGTDDSDAPDASDGPLDEAVVEAIRAHDDGDGADRDAVVDTLVADRGVSAAEVDAAIEQAMMSGECYEPADGTLKAI